jgi:hypothetical protein
MNFNSEAEEYIKLDRMLLRGVRCEFIIFTLTGAIKLTTGLRFNISFETIYNYSLSQGISQFSQNPAIGTYREIFKLSLELRTLFQ